MRKATKFEGLSAAVNINGTTWQGVSGNSYNKHPMTTDMELCIGSDSKLFTTTLILKLQEAGVLHLDDSLYRWLPAMTNIDSTITIRQILNHTSGIADYLGSATGFADTVMKAQGRYWKPEELMKNVGTPYFTKGTNWAYSNTDYILAGMIVKKASKDAFTHQLHSKILSLLNLTNTYMDAEDTLKGTIAHPWENGYDLTSILYTPRTAMSSMSWAAGGMYSTALDMANWYQAMFSGKVLKPSSMQDLLNFVPCNPAYGQGYGLGITWDTMNGRKIYRHGGAVFGYLSRNIYDSVAKTSIFVLANQDGIEPDPVVAALHKVIIDNPTLGIEESNAPVIESLSYPNPFSNTLNIRYTLTTSDRVRIKISTMTGKMVYNIDAGIQPTGVHDFQWSVPYNLPSGVYIYTLETLTGGKTSKMIVKY